MRGFSVALRHLSAADPILNKLITQHGNLNFRPSSDLFASLVYSIIEQQLSLKAARTIYQRFLQLFPQLPFTPAMILALDPTQIRQVGTSWAKVRSLQDLSQRLADGRLDLASLSALSDEDIISALTAVRGIGPWSAQMRLMFSFNRLDVLPLSDIGIQNAFVKLYGLNRSHKSMFKRMTSIAAPWRPFRTVACLYLWAFLDNRP